MREQFLNLLEPFEPTWRAQPPCNGHGSSGGYSEDATTLLAGVRIFADPPGSTLRSSLIGVPMNIEPIQFGLAGLYYGGS